METIAYGVILFFWLVIIWLAVMNRRLQARLGGEEFGIVVTESNLENAIALANRIRKSLKSVELLFEQKHLPTITLSIGATDFRPDDEKIDAIIARADAALYEVKNGGRDNVKVG